MLEKRQFFSRKVAKIAENCDHKIDSIFKAWGLIKLIDWIQVFFLFRHQRFCGQSQLHTTALLWFP
jgi:hypothetical protein